MPIELIHSSDAPPPLGKTLVELEIRSEFPDKDIVLERFLHELRERGLLKDDDDEMRVRLVLDEALLNAIGHGNKFSDQKKVTAGLYDTETHWAIRIEDEGEGFHPSVVPDPDNPEDILLDHGRGIVLMKGIMDDVRFYRSGRCLVLIRKKA